MKWINHIAIAGAIAAVIEPKLVPVVVFGSTAPDWLEGLLKHFYRYIKHRGVTHYVASWAGGLLFGLVVWDFQHLIAAFSAGGLAHVLCDALTVSGVPLSGWSDRRFHLFGGRLHTGGAGEYLIAAGVVVVCFGISMETRHWDHRFSPFFYDWADYYHRGLVDGKEWRENRFKWF